MVGVVFFILFELLIPSFLEFLLSLDRLLFLFLFCRFERIVEEIHLMFVLLFCFIPITLHQFFRFSSSQFLSFNYELSCFYFLQKLQKLWVLKSRIRVIHHDIEHWGRTVQYVCLLLFVSQFSVVKLISHLELVFPLFCLLCQTYIFEVLHHRMLLRFQLLLSLHPMHLLHCLKLLLLLQHRLTKLSVHHSLHLSVLGLNLLWRVLPLWIHVLKHDLSLQDLIFEILAPMRKVQNSLWVLSSNDHRVHRTLKLVGCSSHRVWVALSALIEVLHLRFLFEGIISPVDVIVINRRYSQLFMNY